jgi:hypothetical protein
MHSKKDLKVTSHTVRQGDSSYLRRENTKLSTINAAPTINTILIEELGMIESM